MTTPASAASTALSVLIGLCIPLSRREERLEPGSFQNLATLPTRAGHAALGRQLARGVAQGQLWGTLAEQCGGLGRQPCGSG